MLPREILKQFRFGVYLTLEKYMYINVIIAMKYLNLSKISHDSPSLQRVKSLVKVIISN